MTVTVDDIRADETDGGLPENVLPQSHDGVIRLGKIPLTVGLDREHAETVAAAFPGELCPGEDRDGLTGVRIDADLPGIEQIGGVLGEFEVFHPFEKKIALFRISDAEPAEIDDITVTLDLGEIGLAVRSRSVLEVMP